MYLFYSAAWAAKLLQRSCKGRTAQGDASNKDVRDKKRERCEGKVGDWGNKSAWWMAHFKVCGCRAADVRVWFCSLLPSSVPPAPTSPWALYSSLAPTFSPSSLACAINPPALLFLSSAHGYYKEISPPSLYTQHLINNWIITPVCVCVCVSKHMHLFCLEVVVLEGKWIL